MKTLKKLGKFYRHYIKIKSTLDREGPVYDLFDIAIITLGRVVRYTENISPICLPSNAKELYVGSIGTVAGWGVTNAHDLEHLDPSITDDAEALQRANLEILKMEECKVIETIDPFAGLNFTLTQ